MYDVQPTSGQDWIVPPFDARVVSLPGIGEALVARGAHNSKVAVVAQVLAVEVLRDLRAPISGLTILVDGEEEVGSPSLRDALDEVQSDIMADGAFSLELGSGKGGLAELALGCKGLLKLELSVQGGDWGGPVADIHSCEQPVVASPVWALVRALATLVGPDDRVTADGFYDTVSPRTETDTRLIARMAALFDERDYLDALGVSTTKIVGGLDSTLDALVFAPTFNISSIHAGHYGEGTSNIIPATARATIDIRLVPEMAGGDIVSVLRRRLDETGHSHVSIRVLECTPWARARTDNSVASAIERAQSQVSLQTLRYPIAPYMVPFQMLMELSDGNCAVGSIGHAAGAHGPNEYASIEGIKQHIVGLALFLASFAVDVPGGDTQR